MYVYNIYIYIYIYIYINDLPLSCQSVDVLLFADDNNLTAMNCNVYDIEVDLLNLNNCLNCQ